jgi:hypothetical protein
VVPHVDKGVYFGLNEVAALIWNQLQKPRKVQEIRDAILRKYEVPMSNASANCSRYLENSPKMVHIRDATAT